MNGDTGRLRDWAPNASKCSADYKRHLVHTPVPPHPPVIDIDMQPATCSICTRAAAARMTQPA